ncbi:Ti-type conjugative transfer relaxase TraA, partial [Mesorhizobium sp. M1A.F.Ca.IN.022.07.1.1]|uniref:BID domain-containing protein n=1 Tax=Mesorhizobium sp. M1A.F.Ca.IN.022.07.1.1 TaxID=2496767 RepID=UPI000FD5550D
LAPDRREKLARLFAVVRRFAEEQNMTERQDPSKIVAGASVAPAREAIAPLPMLAAVTEFKTPVEEEARERALAARDFRLHRAALAETATRIWRDPAGAVTKIEELIVNGFPGGRIAAAVSNDPGAYGALRGTDRMMDRLLAAGRERKEALQAVPEAASHVRSLGASFAAALDSETRAITEERQRMAVAIPGLSPAAEDALRQLTAARKNVAKRDLAPGSIDPRIAQEFTVVSRALDERFGRNALLRGEKDVINRVTPAQRSAFQAMRDRLQVLQQTVRTQSSQEIISERQRRVVDRVRGVTQ